MGSMCTRADLWKRVRERVDDWGGIKVKGHALVRDDHLSADARYWRLGNKFADQFARLGASRHPQDLQANDRVLKSASLSTYVCKYICRTLRAVGPPASTVSARDVETRGRRRPPPRLTADEEAPAGEHDIVQFAGKLRCVRCLRVAKVAKTLRQAPCRPAVGHRLWCVGPFTFCSSCGAHSCDNTQLLAVDCRGHCERGSSTRARLDHLWSGNHPRTGAKLPFGSGPKAPTPFGGFALDVKFGGLEVLPDW